WWLRELVACSIEHPSAGSIAGKILSYTNRTTIQSAGETITWDGMPQSRGGGERDQGQYEISEAIFGVTAGAGLFRQSAFRAVGLFDEDFVTYHEAIDWGFGARLRGFWCWYTPKDKPYHMGKATSNRISDTAA